MFEAMPWSSAVACLRREEDDDDDDCVDEEVVCIEEEGADIMIYIMKNLNVWNIEHTSGKRRYSYLNL